MISPEMLFFGGFSVVVLGALLFDLLVVGRHSHVVSFKEAGLWTAVWVSLAVGFYFIILHYGHLLHGVETYHDVAALAKRYAPYLQLVPGDAAQSLAIYRANMGMEFLSGYIIEYTLSMDNVFVIMMLLSSFSVPKRDYKQVLFWGILGAIVMRFVFIFLGAALIEKFDWILLLFGVFLLYTGAKVFIHRNEPEEKINVKKHPLVLFLSKHINIFPRFYKDHFFLKRRGKLYVTPLFVVLMLIELTDLIFATDSIPAVFAVTRDPYIVFFSNIFAIIGLRSLFFLLIKVVDLFHYLKTGIAFLLTFVGAKLLLHSWLEELHFKPEYSLYIIVATLVICIAASLLFPPKSKQKFSWFKRKSQA